MTVSGVRIEKTGVGWSNPLQNEGEGILADQPTFPNYFLGTTGRIKARVPLSVPRTVTLFSLAVLFKASN